MTQPTWDLPNRVGDLMSRRLVTVSSGVDLSFAMQMMLWEGVRHLPVVDDGKLVGILSDRDFLPTSSGGTMQQFLARPVHEVMSTEVRVVSPDAEVSAASALMATAHINALPVVGEDGELVGILTSADILAERGRLFFKASVGKVPSIGDIMTDAPSVAHRDDALVEVATRMIDEGIRHLPVVDGDGVVIGMLAERDLRGVLGDLRSFLAEGETPLDTQRVDDVMTPNPVTVLPSASLFDLASCYIDDRIGAVPVVDDDDRLIGIVSYIDLLSYLVKGR